MLAAEGYESLVNLDGGFLGKKDEFGNMAKKGWTTHGFPSTTDVGPDRSYDALR